MASRLPQALGIVATFVLVGPPVGALVFALIVTLFTMIEGDDIGMLFVYGALAFLPLAWLVGGLQAAAVGLATAAFAWRRGSAPAAVPAVAALVVGAFAASRNHEQWDVTAVLVAVHVLAALACWALLRLAPGRPPQRH